MNGIIRPCTHPEDRPAPKNEDEMMVAIFKFIDRIFTIVGPRRALYMALDVVAPRAKMNQQCSRHFRASKETAEKIEEVARICSELKSTGAYVPPEKSKGEHLDSNCITPVRLRKSHKRACFNQRIRLVGNRLSLISSLDVVAKMDVDVDMAPVDQRRLFDVIGTSVG